MYTQYVYNAGATQANITADLVAVLTGETDKNNLSAGCNKTNTVIQAVVAAGWTLHDTDGGSGSKVIKAPLADDATKFKYVRLYSSATTSIRFEVYEGWDAGTNVGTNMCYYSDTTSYSQRLDLTNGGTIHVFSSARFAMLCAETSGGWGSATYSGPSGCFERTRLLPFDTVAYGMPPFAWFDMGYCAYNSSYQGFAPRLVDRLEASKTSSVASLYAVSIGYSNILAAAPSGVSQKVPDGLGGFLIPFIPIYLANLSSLMPAPYGEISSLCDVWKVPDNLLSNKEVIQKNGLDYMVIKTYSATQFIVARKG
ncbi:MAG: hypothetical protein HQL07_03845 [Nitrospirae bacterium]|nr:hypothetical protein [Magnetococcales bacterium]HAT48853.1 hypothetical protein [Alphaproteobacteria bacterium]